jgi:hypothetical protein
VQDGNRKVRAKAEIQRTGILEVLSGAAGPIRQ